MGGSQHAALGATFKITRLFQIACIFPIIGITANFVAEMVALNATPPSVLIGILSIVCIAVLYCSITVILYFDSILPFLFSTIIDDCFLIALIVVSVVVGKPLSYLDCKVLGDISNAASTAYDFAAALDSSIKTGQVVKYTDWIGTSKSTCLEMKSIWGLCIALCVLFTFSAVSTICLGRRTEPAVTKSEV